MDDGTCQSCNDRALIRGFISRSSDQLLTQVVDIPAPRNLLRLVPAVRECLGLDLRSSLPSLLLLLVAKGLRNALSAACDLCTLMTL